MKRYARTLEELAGLLGTSHSQLIRLGQRGCPCTRAHKKNGRYAVEPVRKWREEHGHAGNGTKTNGHGGPVDGLGCTARQRLLEAQASEREEKARVAEIQRLRLEGALMPIAEHEETLLSRHRFFKAEIENLPRRLPPRLAGRGIVEITAILRDEVDRMMRAWSEGGSYAAEVTE